MSVSRRRLLSPFSPPPPCGDEKEEDSAEEEEADGGGGAPRDLGWEGAGRGGPGTAPLEPRVLRNSPRRTRSAGRCRCVLLRAWLRPGPSHLPLPSRSGRHLSPAAATRRREKGTSPPPSGSAEPPKPTPGSGAGTPGRRRGFLRIFAFLACISERIKNGRECGGTGAAFSQAA